MADMTAEQFTNNVKKRIVNKFYVCDRYALSDLKQAADLIENQAKDKNRLSSQCIMHEETIINQAKEIDGLKSNIDSIVEIQVTGFRLEIEALKSKIKELEGKNTAKILTFIDRKDSLACMATCSNCDNLVAKYDYFCSRCGVNFGKER